jgi:hypothetical protein
MSRLSLRCSRAAWPPRFATSDSSGRPSWQQWQQWGRQGGDAAYTLAVRGRAMPPRRARRRRRRRRGGGAGARGARARAWPRAPPGHHNVIHAEKMPRAGAAREASLDRSYCNIVCYIVTIDKRLLFMGRHRILAERASVACMQKILRILLLRAENSARGLQEIGRDFHGFPGRVARADPSVRRHRRLAERALHAPVPTHESHCGGPAAHSLVLPAQLPN